MALMGDKLVSDEDISDGVYDSHEEDGSEDSLSARLKAGVVKTANSDDQKTLDSDTPLQAGIYEEMDDFQVPDEAFGRKIGVISENKLLQGALEGFVSLR